MNASPDVSVYMLTYYHEKYVAQAIESVLSQKTRYSFELVISDDCSQDGTVKILREYESKYPDIIRVNYNTENIGIPANIYKARCMCRGRYITVLAGDDYFINESKIEDDTLFMDNHPEYIALFDRSEMRMNDSDKPYEIVPALSDPLNREYTIRNYEKCEPLGTNGFFMRNFFLTEEGRKYFGQAGEISAYVDDAVDEVLILRKGPVYLMDYISYAHRVVPSDGTKMNYNSRYSRLEKYRHHIELLNAMDIRWGDEIDFSNWYAKYTAAGILGMLVSMDLKGYKPVFASIPEKYKKPAYKGVYVRSISQMVSLVTNRINRKLRSR